MLNGTSNNLGVGKDPDSNKVSVAGNVALTGSVKIQTAGQGIVLKSPDGATCKLVALDNGGNLALTTAACP